MSIPNLAPASGAVSVQNAELGNAKRILIVGATSAIAQELGRLFARKGDLLFLVARDQLKVAAVAEDLKALGSSSVQYEVSDLNDYSAHSSLLDHIFKTMDGLDVAILAHGILGDQNRAEADYKHAEEILRTNFLSTASLLTHLGNQFAMQRRGVIAVISSVAGDRGRQSNYVYGASKGGLDIFLQGLRNRLFQSGVCVITVKPGFVDTPMTAHLKKNALFASPEVIARGIQQAIRKKKDVIYTPWFWRYIMLVVRLVPETVFKRMRM